jgi:hypothetical protein
LPRTPGHTPATINRIPISLAYPPSQADPPLYRVGKDGVLDCFIADVEEQLTRRGKKLSFQRVGRKQKGAIVGGRMKKAVECEIHLDDTASFPGSGGSSVGLMLPRGERLFAFADRQGVSLMLEAEGKAGEAGCWSWKWGKIDCVYDYGYMLGLKLTKGGTVEAKVS